MRAHRVELGDRVRDRATGFTGIAYARTRYLYGCERISIQPPVDADGKLPEQCAFDEPGIEVLEECAPVTRPAGAEPGGPITRGGMGR